MRFLHPDDVAKTLEYESHFMPSGFYNRWMCKDGTFRYLSWTGLSPVSQPNLTFSIVRDITLERLLQEHSDVKIKILNDQLQFRSAVARAVQEIQQMYLGPLASNLCSTDGLQPVVSHFVRLTGSAFGVLRQGTESPTLLNVVGSVDALSPAVMQQMEERLSQAATTRAGVSDVVGTEPFLALPLIADAEVGGVLGLGGRPRGYPAHLQEWLDPLLVLTTRLVRERRLLSASGALVEAIDARKKAESASGAKSAFLAHMSHELRTPLSGIIGLLELIDKDLVREEDRGYLRMAGDSARALLTILNDILDLSKIEADQLQLEAVDFEPQVVLDEVVRLLAPEGSRKGVALVAHVDASVPRTLHGDANRLRQILLNLAGNAVKFTEHGGVMITLRGKPDPEVPALFSVEGALHSPATDYRLNGSVQDTGIGMGPETVDALFHAFVQGDCSMARRFGGTGLGLFISKRLCVMMGGGIDVSSKRGEGSTFRFNVRMGVSSAPTAPGPLLGRAPSLPPLRALVVDDNPVNQVIMKTVLRKAGCICVDIAEDGFSAVQAALAAPYDVILMDVQMPGMDGMEATRRIRAALGDRTPIIGVTAHAMKGDCEMVLACGMNAYIVKPVSREDLVAAILRYLPPLPAPLPVRGT